MRMRLNDVVPDTSILRRCYRRLCSSTLPEFSPDRFRRKLGQLVECCSPSKSACQMRRFRPFMQTERKDISSTTILQMQKWKSYGGSLTGPFEFNVLELWSCSGRYVNMACDVSSYLWMQPVLEVSNFNRARDGEHLYACARVFSSC